MLYLEKNLKETIKVTTSAHIYRNNRLKKAISASQKSIKELKDFSIYD